MPFVLVNFGSSTLSASIDSTQVTIPVSDASSFGIINPGDIMPLVIEDANGNVEIVHATSLAGDTFTVVRGAEGTTPQPFAAGARVECRLTAEAFNSQQVITDIDGGTY